jgi:hypothetical protein
MASAVLLIDITVAIFTTKLPVLLRHKIREFALQKLGMLLVQKSGDTLLNQWYLCTLCVFVSPLHHKVKFAVPPTDKELQSLFIVPQFDK